ncbi:MAG: hypothetical protein OEY51_01455 [Cyclobacteriaceae bacterium]|nr:hypothetical protein [Cyclobacteriaceae bacterium]
MLIKIIILGFFGLITFNAFSQEILKFGDTEKTNSKPTYETNPDKLKAKNITFIIKKSQKGLLLGNKCLEDYTMAKGYVYLVQIKGPGVHYGFWGRVIHNFGAKATLLFKVGPHWKLAWKKKRKECQNQLHDFVG